MRSRALADGGLAAAAVSGLTALLAVDLVVRSRSWALVHDAPLMHYVGWRILGGAVPYRDLFDMNFPGVYLVHVASLALLGPGDLAFRLVDLGGLALTAAGLAMALAPVSPWAGVSAGALFALFHLAGGPWLAGQRDVLLCAPLAWTAAGAAWTLRRRSLGGLALAGGALGVAVWLKPHAALLAPALASLAWHHPGRWRALSLLGTALLAPAVAVLAWLGAAGALPAFVDVVGGYLLPLYSRLGREPLLDALLSRDYGLAVLVLLPAWAALGLWATWRAGRVAGELGGLWRVAAVGIGYGLAHLVLQGRGWEYHAYPLVLGLAIAGGSGLGSAIRTGRHGLALAMALLLGTAALGLTGKGERNLRPEWIEAKLRRVDAVVRALRPVVAAGGTVQVLDTTDGGVHALLRLAARQPTRFLYDFHFHHDVGHPYVDRLRRELLAGLATRPPAAVVLFERGWPTGGYERLDGFPGLRDWLARGYGLAQTGDGWRLYLPQAVVVGRAAVTGSGR